MKTQSTVLRPAGLALLATVLAAASGLGIAQDAPRTAAGADATQEIKAEDTSAAAGPAYIKLGGVDGESTDSASAPAPAGEIKADDTSEPAAASYIKLGDIKGEATGSASAPAPAGDIKAPEEATEAGDLKLDLIKGESKD